MKAISVATRIMVCILSVVILDSCAKDRICEMEMELNLKQGIAMQWPADPSVKVLLIETDPANSRARFKIFRNDGLISDDGWVNENQFASFSSLMGSSGFQLIKVNNEMATVEARTAKRN